MGYIQRTAKTSWQNISELLARISRTLTERKLNRVRRRAANDLRYWRATAQSGTIDLGHCDEAQAVKRTAKMGAIVYVDWVNAIIVYGSMVPEKEGEK